VTDYKSGGKKLDSLLVKNGVQLQLLAYLAEIRSWPPEVWAQLNQPAAFSLSSPQEERGEGEESKKFTALKIIPAGAFYVNLRGEFKGGGSRAEVLGDIESKKLAYRHNG